MFKQIPKSTSTTSQTERNRKNAAEAILFLEKCTQISVEDRLSLRNYIKEGGDSLLVFFKQFKKDKRLSQLQIKLRKYLKEHKNEQGKELRSNRHTSSAKRIYSQQSMMSSYQNSLRGSLEKTNPKKKVITIDIAEIRKSIEKDNSKTFLKSISSPRLKLDRTISRVGLRKGSTPVIRPSEPQVYIEELHTLPENYSLTSSEEKPTQFQRSPRPSFFNQICQNEQIDNLLRSKLKKKRLSKQHHPVEGKSLGQGTSQRLFQSKEEFDKENRNSSNRQVREFLTDRTIVQQRWKSPGGLRIETDEQMQPVMFGQFHRRIRDILNCDQS